MKKIKLQLMFILSICHQLISGQGKAPEDYSLGKKVNVSSNYNTGKLDLNIPIYNIDIQGYKLSGQLNYLQEVPKNEPSILGTNWDLNIGGKIVIAHSNAAKMHEPQVLGGTPNGFHSSSENNCIIPSSTSNVSKKQILDNPNNNLTEYDPNIFYFDFMGNSGYFVYDNVGNFLVHSENDMFTVTYSGSKCQDIFQPIAEFPEIVMKDSKGNQYYFGGDYNSVDVYYAKNKYEHHSWYDDGNITYFNDLITNKHINYLSALYIKKIKLANNRVIDFFYKNGNKTVMDPFNNGGLYINSDYSSNIPSNNTLLSNNIYLGEDKSGSFSSISNSSSANSSSSSINKTNIYYKYAILESIKASDAGTLNFSYIQMNNTYTKPFLKKIEIINNNKIIKNINFNYNTEDGRVFLESLISNDEKYQFEYNTYLNQNNEYNNAGLIKKIIYPTKGREEFEYESNDVSKINKINSGGNIESDVVVNENSVMPGQRIKMIRTYANSSMNYTYKKYTYKNDNGSSSGIATTFSSPPGNISTDPSYSSHSTSLMYSSNFDENVRYSKVTEEIPGKEKSEYYFTDIITNPDSIAVKKYTNNSGLNLGSYLQQKNSIKISKKNERGRLYKLVAFNAGNAAILTKEIKYGNFLNGANPIKEIPNNCIDCKVTDDRYYVQAKKIYFQPSYYVGFYQYQPVLPYVPISIKMTEEIPFQTINGTLTGGKLVNSEKYLKYNTKSLYWHPYPVETTEYLPYPWPLPNAAPVYNGKTISRTYYPQDLMRNNPSCISGNCPPDSDLVGEKFSIYKYMVDNSITLPIIEEVLNPSNKVKLSEHVYSKDALSANLLKINKHRESLLNSNLALDNYSSAIVNEKIIFQQYDNLGNLLQSKSKDGVPTTIIYGYKQTLPIAEIQGATYSQIMQTFNLDPNNNTSYLQLDIVNKSNLDVNELTETDLISALNSFRSKPEFSGLQISTYTYNPLVGVTSSTSPSGIKEIYRYDSYGRLRKILDAEGNPVKENKYNYAP